MKIGEALRKPDEDSEPSLEERLGALEARYSILLAAKLSEIGTHVYNDPDFGSTLINHIQTAQKARYEDDAADIGG